MDEEQMARLIARLDGIEAAVGTVQDDVNEIKHEVKRTNGRVTTLEGDAVAARHWRVDTDRRLDVIEPITEDIAEIVGFTRTTGKIARWTGGVAGGIAGLAGFVALAQGWLT